MLTKYSVLRDSKTIAWQNQQQWCERYQWRYGYREHCKDTVKDQSIHKFELVNCYFFVREARQVEEELYRKLSKTRDCLQNVCESRCTPCSASENLINRFSLLFILRLNRFWAILLRQYWQTDYLNRWSERMRIQIITDIVRIVFSITFICLKYAHRLQQDICSSIVYYCTNCKELAWFWSAYANQSK